MDRRRHPTLALAALAVLALAAPVARADAIRPESVAEALPAEVVAELPAGIAPDVAAPVADDATRTTRAGRSWAADSIRTVLGAGALPGVTMASFRPNAVLDGATLDLLVSVAFPSKRAPVNLRGRDVITMGQLDYAFVRAAGLLPAVRRARRALEAHGIGPRSGGGVEIAARLLALRYNHPSGTDQLERSPWEPATMAEGAYTAAQALAFSGWEADYVAGVMAMLDDLPDYTPAQRGALRRATRLLGQPYIWGGEWDGQDSPYGWQEHGGYDCSGFVWRVFALYPGAPESALDPIGGRTTYDMAKSTPRKRRLLRKAVRPGDLLLFASYDNKGRATGYDAVGHVGIALSPSLFIHSSSQGVAVARWDEGWYADSFAFGRRVLG